MASRFVEQVEKIWYGEIKPGPEEVGFEYSFIFAIKADRVSTVFLQNHSVIALDSSDPIQVSYDHKIGNDPTGREHPRSFENEMLSGARHHQTIVNVDILAT